MALTKVTIVDQVEVPRSGFVQVRMRKQILDDGQVVAEEYHRTAIAPDASPDAQLADVNEHLESMGAAPVSSSDWDRVRTIAAAVHTDEVKAAYAKQMAADLPKARR